MYHFELTPNLRRSNWEKEVEKVFDVLSQNNHFAPPCEITEEEKFFSISIDMPGVKKEEIQIEVKDNRLFVAGQRAQRGESESKTILRSERKYGKFERIYSIPQNVNSDGIEAQFEDGVLTLLLPKEEKSQSKKISISNGRMDSSVLKS